MLDCEPDNGSLSIADVSRFRGLTTGTWDVSLTCRR